MNRFDERYEIRFAEKSEIDEVMRFIDTKWKKGHILATNRDLFEYEHVIGGKVNFLIAKEKQTGDIHGILGYLPASRNQEKYDIWSVVWKVDSDVAMSMLGIELQKRLVKYTGARTCLGVGDNPQTAIPLLKNIFHYKVAKMNHYYCIQDKEKYDIAYIGHKEKLKADLNDVIQVERLNTIDEVKTRFDFLSIEGSIPYKDAWYVDKRYYRHPIYEYQLYGLSRGKDQIQALLVCREQEYNGCKVLRIVDYMGMQELFGGLSSFFKNKLEEYEYIDFYFYGFPEEYVQSAGMIKLKEQDTNIIPDYFHPFLQKNIDIWISSSCEGCTFFKADGDQDRPN